MSKYLVIVFLLLFFMPFAFADINILINTTDDTFTSFSNSYCSYMNIGSYSGNQYLNDSYNYGNLTEVLYTLCCNTGFLSYSYADTRAFFKFPTYSIDRIVTDIRYNMGTITRFNYGSLVTTNVYYSPNQAWNEYEITRLNEPIISNRILANNNFNYSNHQTDNIIETSNLNFVRGNTGTLEFIDRLYSDENITIVFKGSETGNVTCGALQVGNQIDASSRDTDRNDYPAYLNITMTDFLTGFVNISWGGWGNDNFYFDFESQTASSSQRNQDDFRLTRTGSIFVPPNTFYPLQQNKASIYSSVDYSGKNTLDITNCYDESLVYSNIPISNLNNPIGTHWVLCLNLSNEHRGLNYFGSIKIIDDNSQYTSFYYAFYSPYYTSFSNIVFNPSKPKNNDSVIVSYTTTNLLTSGIFVNAVIDGVAIPTSIYTNDTLKTSHSLLISNIQAGFFNATYCARQFGYDAQNTTFIGNEYCFNVTPTDRYIISRDKAFENYTDSIILLPKDDKTKLPIYATCVLTPAPCNLPICNSNQIPCIVMNTTEPPCLSGQNKCWFYCESGLSSCNYLNQISSCSNPSFSAESCPLSECPKLFYNGTFANTYFIGVHIGSDIFYYNPFYWNYTCYADGYNQIKGSFKVYTPLPYFYDLLFSKKPSCIATYIGLSSLYECQLNMNNSGSNAWYCSYDANRCRTYSGDKCITYGTWTGYECESCDIIPLGYACNGTLVNATGGSITPSDLICEGMNRIFNRDCNSSLSFVALLISLVLTAIVGFYSRNGLIAGLVLLVSIFMFYFIGWIPLWVIIILGVITAFLIAKFIVSSISPQGSGG